MSNFSVYILKLSNERQTVFNQNNVEEYGQFAEAVKLFSHSKSFPLVVLIIQPNGILSHIGRGRRGLSAGTGLRRLNITDMYALTSTVTAHGLLDSIEQKFQKHLSSRIQNGGKLPKATSVALVDTLIELAPECRESISAFSTLQRELLEEFSSSERVALAYQKEAIATALNISGIPRDDLADWEVSGVQPASFLEGLPEARLREDPMIVNDLMNVPGYEFIKTIPNASAAVFKNEGKRLTVILANRLPLEQQTGTDLIYYNETYKAFVMVQYKAMEKHNTLGAVFRHPEKQLTEEVNRMDDFLIQLGKVTASKSKDNVRLSENPFFFKFCPRIQFEPNKTGLTKGMYIPFSYWKALEAEPLETGRKTKDLAYSTVGRYFDNTSFAMMVANAWVGTSISQSTLLEKWIRDVIGSGRAITFAVKNESAAEENENIPEPPDGPDEPDEPDEF